MLSGTAHQIQWKTSRFCPDWFNRNSIIQKARFQTIMADFI